MGPAHVENLVDLACRTALSRRGVAHLTMPVDVQSMPAARAGTMHSRRNVFGHTSDVYFHGLNAPDVQGLERAAAVLKEGSKVAILAGRGAIHATDALLRLSSTVVCMSRKGAQILKRVYNAPDAKVAIVPHGAPSEPEAARTRESLAPGA